VKKKTLLFLMVFVMLLPLTTYGANLSYWYSNETKIGYLSNRNVWAKNMSGGFSDADFLKYYNYARNEWSSNAGISTYGSNEASTSTINWYAGKVADLTELEPSLANKAAVTANTEVYVGAHSYNGTAKNNYRISKAKIYTPTYWYNFDTDNKEMFAHEMGHAIGWLGHSAVSSDLMHGSYGGPAAVTTRDVNHIKQNY